RAVTEIVEYGDAVGLGPYADRARAGDVRIVQLDVALAVERNSDVRADELDMQHVPGVRGNRGVDVLDRDAPAVLGVIERDVVLQRVGAGDVVVVPVFPAPDDAARLIFLARKRFELHLDVAVGDRNVTLHAPGKVSASGLLEHVGRARRRGVRFDGPARRAATRDAGNPSGRQAADGSG